MKHSVKITVILLTFFLLSQFIGLGILYQYIDAEKSAETGETEFADLPIIERPEFDEQTSYIPAIIAILLGTVIILFLMKRRIKWLWKLWFLMTVVITLTIAFSSLMPTLAAGLLALFLGIWRIFKPNVFIQNGTELFIYGGLAAIFVPLFNLFSVSILMILIAIYDVYAVWKSKHMITLAKEQADAKVFAGLLIPYQLSKVQDVLKQKKKSAIKMVKVKVRTAMLGGGDVGFPLIFAGVVMKELSLWQSFIIPFFALVGLAVLLWKAEEKKFYPAMPFIGAGCFIGLGVVLLLGLF